MPGFDRRIAPRAMDALRRMAEADSENWFKDLLRQWGPSGNKTEGLRLAVRRNYLNFYLKGQSIARVGVARNCQPYLDTHVKYASPGGETAQAYVRLVGEQMDCPKANFAGRYIGPETLAAWMKRSERHAGVEKTFVDHVVANNGRVIDVEMGLPGTANRMDLVCLEPRGPRIAVVFWEAKTIDDGRLRCRGQAAPKVVGQLQRYVDYLAIAGHAVVVRNAYSRACSVLVELHGLAAALGPMAALHNDVRRAANSPEILDIDPQPRLLIYLNDPSRLASWPPHRAKLDAFSLLEIQDCGWELT